MKESLVTETIQVSGKCEMCVERIETTAKSVEGVSDAKWDIRSGQLRVTFDGTMTTSDAICKSLAAAGHDAGKEKAPDDVYNSLPVCCKYR